MQAICQAYRHLGRLSNRMTTRMASGALPEAPGKVPVVDYGQVRRLVDDAAKPSSDSTTILVDVRPPAEIAECGGTIRTARNLPRTIGLCTL